MWIFLKARGREENRNKNSFVFQSCTPGMTTSVVSWEGAWTVFSLRLIAGCASSEVLVGKEKKLSKLCAKFNWLLV